MDNQPAGNKQPELSQESRKRINRGFWEFVYGIGEYIDHMFELDSDLDRKGTIKNIMNNKRMQGANVWLLICSIMVASIGLDLDSQAVIIGAMLISPLMSPILGIGLGVGINDRDTLMDSLQHFVLAVIIALATSVIYFMITPYGTLTEQIEARTVPTFLDAMVAIFGGVAGIVSSSRKDKSNAIPGVAIATALMPPLCVSGYGIANWNWSIFINSFYLFFLNSVFIALTTYFIVRLLRFPYKSYVNRRDKFRTTVTISVFSIIILIPSAWILYGVWKKQQRKESIEMFMKMEFSTNKRDYLSYKILPRDTINYVFIDYYSQDVAGVTKEEEYLFKQSLSQIGIENPIIIARGTSDAEALINKEIGEVQQSNNAELNEYAKREAEKDRTIARLREEKDSISRAKQINTIVKEAKVFMPHLQDVDLVESKFDTVPILLIQWEDDLFESKADKLKLMEFVKIKTQMDTLVVR